MLGAAEEGRLRHYADEVVGNLDEGGLDELGGVRLDGLRGCLGSDGAWIGEDLSGGVTWHVERGLRYRLSSVQYGDICSGWGSSYRARIGVQKFLVKCRS